MHRLVTGSMIRYVTLVAIVGVVAATGFGVWNESASGASRSESIASARALSDAFSTIAEESSASVVFIEVERDFRQANNAPELQGEIPFPEMFERFFQFRGPQRGPSRPDMPQRGPMRAGQGSGFIIDADGHIMTNHHVVNEADRVVVTLADGRERDAEVIGSDPQTDIAVIKIDADNLKPLRFANSDDIRVGEWVLAIGSPFGLDLSVSSGIVSARGRGAVRSALQGVEYADFIQTDAAINPGNSGGPLLNLDGEVVGMNTAILSRTGGNQGIGFAIPSNMATYVKDQIIDHGTVARGYLGVMISNVSADMAEWFELKDKNGVLVSDVQPDSPAARGGLKDGDVIVEFEDREVSDVDTFRAWVATTAPDSPVHLGVIRDGEQKDLKITLGALDPKVLQAANPVRSEAKLGIGVQELDPEVATELGYSDQRGVVITDVQPGSVAAMAGLRQGMLIQEVNKIPVRSMKDFEDAISQTGNKRSVLLLVRDQQATRYVAIRMN